MIEGPCSNLEPVLKEFEGPGDGPRVGGGRFIKEEMITKYIRAPPSHFRYLPY